MFRSRHVGFGVDPVMVCLRLCQCREASAPHSGPADDERISPQGGTVVRSSMRPWEPATTHLGELLSSGNWATCFNHVEHKYIKMCPNDPPPNLGHFRTGQFSAIPMASHRRLDPKNLRCQGLQLVQEKLCPGTIDHPALKLLVGKPPIQFDDFHG